MCQPTGFAQPQLFTGRSLWPAIRATHGKAKEESEGGCTARLKKRVKGVGAAGPGDQRPEEQRTRDQRTRDQRPEEADQVDQGPRPTLPSCKYKNTAFALVLYEAIVGRDQGTQGPGNQRTRRPGP